MPNYRLTVSYDGTGLCGWQRQPNGPSVQAALETALERLLGHPVACRASGRTDAGVHAAGQVVTFRSERVLPERALVFGTNHHLPVSIAVLAAAVAPDDFDARFSSSGKLYRYHIWNAPVRSPLHTRTHWYVARPLDVAAMQTAADQLIGRHDYAAFRASDCERKTTVRLIRRLAVFRPANSDGTTVHLEVEATAFLKNMVRILTGTLVEVGRGQRSAESIAALLASKDRRLAGPTAPAHGLLLCRVDYGPRTEL